jgi:hypothetical protein
VAATAAVAMLGVPVAAHAADDSGILACQAVANAFGPGTNSPMSPDQIGQIRSMFSDSGYADLRADGTTFVELAQKLIAGGGGDQAGLLNQLKTDYTDLSTACSAHGVKLPTLTIN